MKANTLSLLNSPWMITDAGKNSLYPELLSLLKGKESVKGENKIPAVFMSMHDETETIDIPETSSNSQYISVLSIKSPLFKYDQYCGPVGTRSMTRVLKEWEANDSIVGVVLDIDCPGGQVSGLAEFAKFINNYSKPIVAYTDGMVASAAFYVAAACKGGFIANEYSDFIGSIGTMLHYVDMDTYLREQGVTVEDIYATGSTRKNEEVRAMKKDGSQNLIVTKILDPYREQFVSDMNAYRPGMNSEVFDGAVYKPLQAIELGLLDQIGTLQDAFDKVIELSKATPQPTNSNTNINTMSTTKKLPRVEAVLGLEGPLAISENGTFLNEEQLDTVEGQLETLETQNTSLTQQLAEATAAQASAVEAVQNQLTEATNGLTATEASVDATLAAAGLPVAGTLTEKLTALNTYATEQGAKDGAAHTKPVVDAAADTGKSFDFVDAEASHNQIANSIK
jgi:protease-4